MARHVLHFGASDEVEGKSRGQDSLISGAGSRRLLGCHDLQTPTKRAGSIMPSIAETRGRADADYETFERSSEKDSIATRLTSSADAELAFLLRPHQDGEMSRFLRWVTATHTMRYQSHHRSSGAGHVYQGRFKSFPIQDDAHFLTVARYVERNDVRAKRAPRAELWR